MAVPSNNPFADVNIKEEPQTPPTRPPYSSPVVYVESTPYTATTRLYSFQTPDVDDSSVENTQRVLTSSSSASHSFHTRSAMSYSGEEYEQRQSSRDRAMDQSTTSRDKDVFARMAVNDTTFTPKPFLGTFKDAEKTEQWLTYFDSYTEFMEFEGKPKLRLFKLLMAEQAAEWLRSLPEEVIEDYNELIRAFRSRFALTSIDRLRKATAVWRRDQREDESVDAFITDIRNAAKVVPINDETLIRFAIIRGLKPSIRLHVLQASTEESLEDLARTARVAEAAQQASGQQDEVNKLTDQVAQLLAQLKEKPVAASINEKSNDNQRRVSFVDDRQRRPRSPAQSAPTSPTFNSRRPVGQRRPQWNAASSRDRDNERFRSPNLARRYVAEDRRMPYSSEPMSGHPANRDDRAPAFQPRRADRPQFTSYGRSMSSQPTYGTICDNCGRSHAVGNCGALNLTCYRCQRVGHISRCCRSAPRPDNRSNY